MATSEGYEKSAKAARVARKEEAKDVERSNAWIKKNVGLD